MPEKNQEDKDLERFFKDHDIKAATGLVKAGTIEANKIQAGTIEDSDGSLMAMTNQLTSDLRNANRQDRVRLELSQIESGSITTAQITNESIKEALENMPPSAKAQWDQLGRRLALYSSFDKSHPILSKVQWVPIVGWFYRRKKLEFVLTREPNF